MKNFILAVHQKTFSKHKESTQARISQQYLAKSMSLAEHADFVLQQYHVFKNLEEVLDQAETDSSHHLNELVGSLKKVYRSESLLNDYKYACELLNKSPNLNNIWSETKKIIDEIQTAGENKEYDLINAHVFVNYLAALNGGTSVLKASISSIIRNYGGSDAARGVTFYVFKDENGVEVKPNLIKSEVEEAITKAVKVTDITPNDFALIVSNVYKLSIEQLEHKSNICASVSSLCSSLFSRKTALAAAAISGAFIATAVMTMRN